MKPDFYFEPAGDERLQDFIFPTLHQAVEELAKIGLSPRFEWYQTPWTNALTCSYHGGYKWSLPFLPVGISRWSEEYPTGGTLRTQVCPKFTAAELRKWSPAKRDPRTQYPIFARISQYWVDYTAKYLRK